MWCAKWNRNVSLISDNIRYYVIRIAVLVTVQFLFHWNAFWSDASQHHICMKITVDDFGHNVNLSTCLQTMNSHNLLLSRAYKKSAMVEFVIFSIWQISCHNIIFWNQSLNCLRIRLYLKCPSLLLFVPEICGNNLL